MAARSRAGSREGSAHRFRKTLPRRGRCTATCTRCSQQACTSVGLPCCQPARHSDSMQHIFVTRCISAHQLPLLRPTPPCCCMPLAEHMGKQALALRSLVGSSAAQPAIEHQLVCTMRDSTDGSPSSRSTIRRGTSFVTPSTCRAKRDCTRSKRCSERR